MKFNWKIISISETELVGEKKLPKITIVIEEEEGEYPDMLVGTIFGEKNVNQYSDLKVWDIVDAQFNMKGRQDPKNGKWYWSNNIWKIETTGSTQSSENDDLPF